MSDPLTPYEYMKASFECIPCLVRQATEAVDLATGDRALKERLLPQLLQEIAAAFPTTDCPVSISQRLHRRVREETGQQDPYHALKGQMNRTALELLPVLMEELRRQPHRREAVVRLTIAGNLLDAGSKRRLAPAELEAHLKTIGGEPLWGSVDDLFQAADDAHCILYLADNAGEIVFDRLLIEALPSEKITIAVRGFPVINDATLEDAETVGLPAIAPVIGNGSDAPGTLLEECSEEFRYWMDRADLIISKGQGNYETLSGTDQNVFFLLTVKCPKVAAEIGAPVGSMVVRRAQNGTENGVQE